MLKTLLAIFLLSSLVSAEEQHTHIYLTYDPYKSQHRFYIKALQADWNTSWEKRINAVHFSRSSLERQKFLTAYAKKMDARVASLKKKVTYHIETDNVDSLCYRFTRTGRRIHLPQDLKTPPDFFIRFAEWGYFYWNRDQTISDYLSKKRQDELMRFEDEARRVKEFLVEKIYKDVKIAFLWYYASDPGPSGVWSGAVFQIMPNADLLDTETYKHRDLKEMGYEPLPAVAWRGYPKKVVNPVNDPYGILAHE